MSNPPLAVRLGEELREELRQEAKRQGVSEAVLVRMFVRDGLANFNSRTERILQNSELLAEQLVLLQQLVGATLHVDVEQLVMSNRQKPDENADDYAQRLKTLYRTSVLDAVSKGKLITAALQQTTPGAKR